MRDGDDWATDDNGKNGGEYEAWAMMRAAQQKRYESAIRASGRLPDSGDWGIIKTRSLGDLLHRVGRFKEARTIYLLAQERVEISSHAYPNDLKASIESRLGYTEVQIGLYAAGFRKLHHAIAISPGEMENHERLRKAYVLRQDDHVVPDVAESTLHSVAKEKPAFSAEMKQLQLPRKPPQSVALALQPFVVDSNNHSWPGSSS